MKFILFFTFAILFCGSAGSKNKMSDYDYQLSNIVHLFKDNIMDSDKCKKQIWATEDLINEIDNSIEEIDKYSRNEIIELNNIKQEAIAKKYTSDKCLGKNVKVSITTIDKYGRSVGFIILPNRDTLNNEIIKAGLAWHYVKYSNSKRLTDLESDAKAHKRGLWADANPVEPWVFRKIKKS
jgi:hypothetical protein